MALSLHYYRTYLCFGLFRSEILDLLPYSIYYYQDSNTPISRVQSVTANADAAGCGHKTQAERPGPAN
jgi:hypothetical protein